MITDVFVGTDRIMLTAYNSRSVITALKCSYVLSRIKDEIGQVDEDAFRAWLCEQPGGADIDARLAAGWKPETDDSLSVDPRNAAEEMKIVGFLMGEKAGRPTAGYVGRRRKGCRH